MKINLFSKVLPVFLLCYTLVFTALAQNVDNSGSISLNRVVPPSPSAADLGKYGQIPVGLSNGTVNFTIPIYEINTGKLKLPISISYNGGGVKVDDMASNIGLGWVLNAGGVVARTVMNAPDEVSPGGYLVSTNPNINKRPGEITLTGQAKLDFFEEVAGGTIDTEPDLFFYNAGNISGKFIFDNVTKKAVTIPYSNNKIEYEIGASSFNKITITDESGTAYVFSNPEYTTPFTYQMNGYQQVLSTNAEGRTDVTGYYLSKIIASNGVDVIDFIYDNTYSTSKRRLYSFIGEIGQRMAENNALVSLVDYGTTPRTLTNLNSTQPVLKEIRFNSGKIEFVQTVDRTDMTTGNATNGSIGRVREIKIYSKDITTGLFTLDKKTVLRQDYFQSPPLPITNPFYYAPNYYRLKLNGIDEYDQSNTIVRTHNFEYNNTPLPPRESYAQDIWGYPNGKVDNQGLLRKQTRISEFNGWGYELGNADRSVSSTNMLAGSLTKITYPTGGATELEYEAHGYLANKEVPSPYAAVESVTAVPGDGHIVSFTFIHDGNDPSGSIWFNIPEYASRPMDREPYVSISSSSGYQEFKSLNPAIDYRQEIAYSFVKYQQYTISAYVHRDSPVGFFSKIEAKHSKNSNIVIQVKENVGGLRIKSIKNLDLNGTVTTKELYKYGKDESGMGTLVANQNVFERDYLKTGYKYYWSFFDRSSICVSGTTNSTKYFSGSILPFSTINGSTISYDYVTKYTVDPANETIFNDKTVYEFYNERDSYWPTGYNGEIAGISYAWKNGLQISSFNKVTSDGTQHEDYRENTKYVLKIEGSSTGTSASNCGIYAPSETDFRVSEYAISMGVRLPKVETKTIAISESTDLIKTESVYSYGNITQHTQPTAIEATDSKGKKILTVIKYPLDYTGLTGTDPVSAGINKFRQANIFNPVEKSTYILESDGTKKLLSSVFTSFNSTLPTVNNIQVIETNTPLTGFNQSAVVGGAVTKDSRYKVRVNFTNYDLKGNLLEQNLDNGLKTSYQWGYNGQYPIAEVKNASSTNIFYDGFEEGNGNSSVKDSKTGIYSHLNAYSKALSGLENGAYTLSYWQKSGGNWTLIITPVTVSAGTYTISLTSQIDDVCFYPANGQMSTYTFKPLTGITSMTDPKGLITTYEYDEFQRVKTIKDQDGNIIKTYDYHYKP